MDIGQSQISGIISQSQSEEKAKYNVVIKKLDQTINLVRQIYGPVHRTKLLQTDYNNLKLTSILEVIYDNIRVNHPLTKLMIEYVKKLNALGDSSKFFVLFIGNLIRESIKVVEKGVKPSVLAEMYRDISCEVEYISKDLVIETSDITAILEGLIKHKKIRDLVSECIRATNSYSSEKIRICKIPSQSLEDSYIVEGMVFSRMPEGCVKKIQNGKTSIYNASLDVERTELKSTIMMNSASDLANFSKNEVQMIKKKIEELSSDVVICSGKVGNIHLDFLNKNNKLVFKVQSKHDLRRLRDLLGGHISPVFEKMPNDSLGVVKQIDVIEEGNQKYTKFIGKEGGVYTIVIKNSLEVILEEEERIIYKALRALHSNVKNGKANVVEGAGRFERKMSDRFLEMSKEVLMKNKNDQKTLEMHLSYVSIANSFKNFKEYDNSIMDIYGTKIKALKYALDFVSTMYETEDYLIGIQQKLNIKPQQNSHWDEDH